MSTKKNIIAIAAVIALHHSPSAWAQGENSPPPAETTQQQDSQPSREQPLEPAKQAETAPPVETIQSSPSDTSSNPDAFIGPKMGLIDTLHVKISEQLLTTAVWLDSFFADERSLKEENRSYIRARYDIFTEEKSSGTYKPTFDIRLALPQLEKKAHIILSAEPAETPSNTPASPSIAGDRIGPKDERNVTTALHYVLRTTPEENFVVRSGLQFSHGTPVLFVAPRYRYFYPINPWGFRFTQEAIWKTDTRWQMNTVFDMERPLPRDFFFRTSAAGSWIETSRGYFYSLSFSLRQPLDVKRALDYEWVNSFQTRPVGELTEIFFRIRYRQNFWRVYLFFEVAPQYRFPRNREYIGTPGILFRLEMFFGRQT
jgi:hypothetical protein